VKMIVVEFGKDKQKNEDDRCEADCETDHVDHCMKLIPQKISERGFQIFF